MHENGNFLYTLALTAAIIFDDTYSGLSLTNIKKRFDGIAGST